MNPSPIFTVCLYSDANFLAVNILENLLSRNCIVKVITNNVNDWRNKTLQLSSNKKFEIIEQKTEAGNVVYDYAIFCGGFINKKKAYFDYEKFILNLHSKNTKTLAIFPFEIYDRNENDKISFSENTGVVFVGDVLGPRINFESDLLISKVLSEIIWKKKLTLAVGEVFYPIFVADAVKVLVKWLFSFGPYGKEILLLGNQVSGDTFWSVNQKLVGNLEIKYDTKIPVRVFSKNVEKEFVNSNLNFALHETYTWLSSSQTETPKTINTNKFKSSLQKRKIIIPNKLRSILVLMLLIFIFPFITLIISVAGSFVGYKSILAGRGDVAKNSFLLAKTVATISKQGSDILGFLPALGLIYKESGFAASFINQSNSIGIHTIPLIKDTTSLFENALSTQVYDSTSLSRRIEAEIVLLYDDIISIREITETSSNENIVLAKKVLTKLDFEKYIKLVFQGRILAKDIPNLLGQNTRKTYLILFENNMELRPTGGFIGSFGLITFDGGRLSDLTVSDVYTADGQLNGHVEPPLPIKNYLGEANWWLRDSNWDPDFPTSAKRAEWFLDKELGKKVDGVVAADLYLIKEILKVIGPVFLPDYNSTITSDNLYETTQNEVQNNFFPGTHKKASFLTALSRSLLGEITGLKASQKLGVLKSFYESLNDRHIQIYLHDSVPQEALASLQWDGAVISPYCGTKCYADMVGVVEANVGMNKSNYFIQRKINLDVNLGIYQIDRKLTLALKNTANTALGVSGRYKNYVRILIPTDSSNVLVKSYTGGIQETLSPEITDIRGHKEVGVLIEVLGSNSKSVEFSWSSSVADKPNLTNYGLYIRKQAGTDEDPIEINIKGSGMEIVPDPRFALTRQGVYGYNTTLAKDIFSLFSW
jgi:hypothetical protein